MSGCCYQTFCRLLLTTPPQKIAILRSRNFSQFFANCLMHIQKTMPAFKANKPLQFSTFASKYEDAFFELNLNCLPWYE